MLPDTLAAVPPWVDAIYVIDDKSTDRTVAVAGEIAARDARVQVIGHERNLGPGAAVVTGYLRAVTDTCDLIGVIGGDNQMSLEDFPALLDPLVEGTADYAKGNRFLLSNEAFEKMPVIRLVGNMIITALTKIASGYFKIADVVDGYTAITRAAVLRVRWEKAWPGYGYPMDFLVRLNASGLRVVDVARRAIYSPGERQSQIKGVPYAFRVAPMLFRDFLWRLFYKYMIRDFHPLVFFYLMGLLLLPIGLCFGIFLIYLQAVGYGVSGPKAVFCALLILTGFQSLIFAMLFDMESSEKR